MFSHKKKKSFTGWKKIYFQDSRTAKRSNHWADKIQSSGRKVRSGPVSRHGASWGTPRCDLFNNSKVQKRSRTLRFSSGLQHSLGTFKIQMNPSTAHVLAPCTEKHSPHTTSNGHEAENTLLRFGRSWSHWYLPDADREAVPRRSPSAASAAAAGPARAAGWQRSSAPWSLARQPAPPQTRRSAVSLSSGQKERAAGAARAARRPPGRTAPSRNPILARASLGGAAGGHRYAGGQRHWKIRSFSTLQN